MKKLKLVVLVLIIAGMFLAYSAYQKSGSINSVINKVGQTIKQVIGPKNQIIDQNTDNSDGDIDEIYTFDSRKSIIDPTCQNFYDGCNTCFRMLGSDEVGCTMMDCEFYQKPRCLDNTTNQSYNSESWKSIISPDCKYFFDGCNDCSRQEDGEIACHEVFCNTYQKPVCTDTQSIKNNEQVPSCSTGVDGTEQCAIPNPYINEISRDEAQNMIIEGNVKGLFQTHSLDIYLEDHEGNQYHTIEPAIDMVFDVIRECGELCKNIPLSTE